MTIRKTRKPSNLKRVIEWLMIDVGLQVYGPVIDENGDEWDESGYADYELEDIEKRWKAIKRAERKAAS